jgi:heme/copper-type cytochrome/quinol oxidase subunit 3
MWLFLASEVMFFTGLIGSYVVLRSGSPSGSYSNLHPPATDLTPLLDKKGVVLLDPGSQGDRVVQVVEKAATISAESARRLVEGTRHASQVIRAGLSATEADALVQELQALDARAVVEDLAAYSWPPPYEHALNPLSIDLTALNTFLLICSSVTMVLALSAIQQGRKGRLTLFLLATVALGSVFLGIQVYEYAKLMYVDVQPVGVSADHHFRPGSSLFASCFFTMTGFHGAHVLAGILTLIVISLQSLRGVYSATHHAAVEMAGLYWHFVDLVWIILFTVVYLI